MPCLPDGGAHVRWRTTHAQPTRGVLLHGSVGRAVPTICTQPCDRLRAHARARVWWCVCVGVCMQVGVCVCVPHPSRRARALANARVAYGAKAHVRWWSRTQRSRGRGLGAVPARSPACRTACTAPRTQTAASASQTYGASLGTTMGQPRQTRSGGQWCFADLATLARKLGFAALRAQGPHTRAAHGGVCTVMPAKGRHLLAFDHARELVRVVGGVGPPGIGLCTGMCSVISRRLLARATHPPLPPIRAGMVPWRVPVVPCAQQCQPPRRQPGDSADAATPAE